MILLKATTETLEIETQGPNPQVDVSISYADVTTTTFSPSTEETKIVTATTTTVLAAPAAATQRQVKLIKIAQAPAGSGQATVILRKDISGTDYIIYTCVLSAGESVEYNDGIGFVKYLRNGQVVQTKDITNSLPFSTQSRAILKVGVTMEGAGIRHLLYNQAGMPGTWAPGTPGLNGRATDGTSASDVGCIPIQNASVNRNYLTRTNFTIGVLGTVFVEDIMWVNSGLVVTTTTAQAIAAPVAIPARDGLGTAAGVDVFASILVTTATTNAGVITNTTITYTNSDGVGSRTGTIPSFPATAVQGTLVPFLLQAGDNGVRSVQSVTLGTSYAGGAISLVLHRQVILQGCPTANVASNSDNTINQRLESNVCLIPGIIPTAATGGTLVGNILIEDK